MVGWGQIKIESRDREGEGRWENFTSGDVGGAVLRRGEVGGACARVEEVGRQMQVGERGLGAGIRGAVVSGQMHVGEKLGAAALAGENWDRMTGARGGEVRVAGVRCARVKK